MFGKNKIAKIESDSGESLSVVNIFNTIQGEGPFAGLPAIFIRLGGCNLQCEFCDTEFDDYQQLSLTEIIKQVKTQKNEDATNLIVITGGEPLRQNIEPLCKLLSAEKFQIQIETNGTIKRQLPKEVTIICSPKITGDSYNITQDLIDYVDSFKFIVSHSGKYSKIPSLNIDKNIYLQPMDEYNIEKNQKNLKYTMKLAKKHNYILGIQMHKIIGVE